MLKLLFRPVLSFYAFAFHIFDNLAYRSNLIQILGRNLNPILFLTTGAGNPGRFMEKWKKAGVKVLPVVASVAMAKMMERAGADAVIAEGP